MIIAPLRLSFVGGGSDVPYFYKRHGGEVVSTSIDKYVKVKITDSDEQKNILFDELLKHLNSDPIKIHSISDIPHGTGLGSSSSFLTACSFLLNTKFGTNLSKSQIAEQAFEIEHKILGSCIGKQDHYASAIGGLNHFVFHKNDKVTINKINIDMEFLRYLENRIIFISLGKTRKANKILLSQKKNITHNEKKQNQMKNLTDLCSPLIKSLSESNINEFGNIIDKGWELKKTFSNLISNSDIDQLYDSLKLLGAYGGKILGAGGTGFLMMVCPKSIQKKILNDFPKLSLLKIKFDNLGVRNI